MHRVVAALTLKKARTTRKRGAALQAFAKKAGLIYFGSVNHQHDDHDVIRGLTVSTTHSDKHYAVGSYDGYDVALVDRYDRTKNGTHSTQRNWCIVQVTLQQATSVPHLFFLPTHQTQKYEHLFAGLRHLQMIDSLVPEPYHHEFTNRYHFYATAHAAIEVQQWIQPATAQGIAPRFWPHAVEVNQGQLYVYIQEHRLDQTVLGSAVESALWLADQIDGRA